MKERRLSYGLKKPRRHIIGDTSPGIISQLGPLFNFPGAIPRQRLQAFTKKALCRRVKAESFANVGDDVNPAWSKAEKAVANALSSTAHRVSGHISLRKPAVVPRWSPYRKREAEKSAAGDQYVETGSPERLALPLKQKRGRSILWRTRTIRN